MTSGFDLFLFSKNEALIRSAVAAGVRGLVIDWENKGKIDRQQRADTQINYDTPGDLRAVRGMTGAQILCRINGPEVIAREEIEDAIQGGADEILVPMVRNTSQVERILRTVDGRCGVGILVETQAAIDAAAGLGRLPVTRVYVGLNDLAIDRGSGCLFTALVDGTVDGIREYFPMPFGIAGVTLPHCGNPIPCRLLIAELGRLSCSFSFLRRSFLRDILGHELSREVPKILEALTDATRRDSRQVAADHQALVKAVQYLEDAGRAG
jgi:hypothetical protein